jgi:ABC-2 type transport system permease protein
MSLRHFWAVTRKELEHIIRSPGTLLLIALMPTLLLLLLAYALTADIRNVPIAVLDQDRTQASSLFVQQLTAGDDLKLVAWLDSPDQIESLFQNNRIKAAIILAPGFAQEVTSMRGLPLQVLIDGTEPQSGVFALDHVVNRAESFVIGQISSQLGGTSQAEAALNPLDMRLRVWYNPDLKSSVAMIPGLLSMVVGLPGLSVALALAREREHGTLEQLMTTPIRRAELLLGKMSPYVLGGIVNVVLTTLVARYWFGVPFQGNFALFFILSIAFLFAILSMGMLIGVFVHTQPAALALSFLLIFFPGFFMTGIFFPINSMPEEMRMEAMALPGTHYAIIARHAFVTGAGLDVLWPYGLALVGLGLAFTGVAALFFEKRLG